MNRLRIIILSLPGAWQRVLQKNIEAYSFVQVVDVVSGSLSASKLVKQHEPDLIIIDSSIPFDDSVTLVQNLKQENPGTRIIAITDTTLQMRMIKRFGADYAVSSFNYEAQIGDLFNRIAGTLPRNPEKFNKLPNESKINRIDKNLE